MDKGGRYEYPCAKVSGEEERMVWYWKSRNLADEYWKGASCTAVSSAGRIGEPKSLPIVLRMRMRNKANTCSGVLYC